MRGAGAPGLGAGHRRRSLRLRWRGLPCRCRRRPAGSRGAGQSRRDSFFTDCGKSQPKLRGPSLTDLDIHSACILLVDDDPGTIQVLHRALGSFSNVRFATSGALALKLAEELQPDLILLDADMPGMSGIETFWKLKSDSLLQATPVIFVTSRRETDLEVEVLELGAVDFISKPVNPVLLRARVGTQLRLKLLTDELRRAAGRDGLTGIANRRQFDECIDAECRRALRGGTPLSLLLADVDHFKAYNDCAGHLAGDDALRKVALVLQNETRRAGELTARYGGEEFAIVLPGLDGEAARQRAEEVRSLIEARAIPHPRSSVGPVVTLSIGVSTLHLAADATPVDSSAARALIQHADNALYLAKKEGRNRVRYEACSYPFGPWTRQTA